MDINYKKKYFKYKNKYLLLKIIKGGSTKTDSIINNKSIDSFKIDFHDNTPPHKIKLYRDITISYLGLIGEVILSEDKFSKSGLYTDVSEKGLLLHSHESEDKMVYENKLFFGKNIDPNNKVPIRIIDYYTHECIVLGCKGKIYIFKKDNEIIVCFNVGEVVDIGKDNMNDLIVKFIEWYKKVNLIFIDPYLTRITFCGHSNGMVAATLFSLMFTLIESDDINDCFIKSGFIDNYNIDKDIIQEIKTYNVGKNKICVCGGGGFPIFNNIECFIKYYNYINGRYLHYANIDIIEDEKVSGVFDNFLIPFDEDSNNKNFKVILYATYNKKIEYYHDKSHDLSKLHGYSYYRILLLDFFN